MVDAWVRGLVKWLSYFLGRGEAERATFPSFQDRFPGITEESFQQAWEETQRGIAAVERFRDLLANQPLSAALGGEEPPAPEVEMRALVRWTGPEGSTRRRLVFINVPWDMPAGLAYETLHQHAADLGAEYEARITSFEIIAPLRYPR